MEVRIVNSRSFTVMGTLTRIATEDEGAEAYGSIWKDFESYLNVIRPLSADQAFYGVSYSTGEQGLIDYLAGMAVSTVENLPAGLEVREVPAARYAVFDCTLEAIGHTYRRVFSEWLPASPYEVDGSAPAYERYPPEDDEGSPVRINIPILEKGV